MKTIIAVTTNNNVRLHWKNSLPSSCKIKSLKDNFAKHYDSIIMFHLQENNLSVLQELSKYNNKIMVFSGHPSFEEGYKLLPLGIKAYANSLILGQTLKEIIEVVERGDAWLYPEFINQMIMNVAGMPTRNNEDILKKLSERETQIALYVSQGLSNKIIAQNADITERTVKAHLSSIFQKLQIKDRLALALLINS